MPELTELLPPIAPAALLLAVLITTVAAAVQGTLGFGFAVVSVPALSLLDSRLAPVPQLLVVGVLTVATFWRERRDADLSGVGWILAGRVPGTAIGVGLLKLANPMALDLMVAALVLLAVVFLAGGFRVIDSIRNQVGAGLVSGVFAVVASIGGPPLALLYREKRGPTIRATLAAIFSVGLVLTVSGRALAGEISWLDLHVAVVLLPALLVGLYASNPLRGRIEGRPLRVGTLALATLAALGLVGRVVVSG